MAISRLGQVLLVPGWIMAVGAGLWTFYSYANTPGKPAQAATTAATAEQVRPHAVMYIHPKCPCTTASLESYHLLVDKLYKTCDFSIVCVVPPGAEKGFADSSNWSTAKAMPHVTATLDQNGALAKAAGAKTSGQVFLFGANGKLAFEGGVTPGRGMEGDSDGATKFSAALTKPVLAAAHAKVFGCPLFED
ncbi:MAG: hypothetical protein ABUL49_00870 [bacterium]